MKIPVVYVLLYRRIKNHSKTKKIKTHDLKEVISRCLMKKNSGGGIPKTLTYDIIKDLERLRLIKRIDHTKYRILKSNCEKRLRKFLWFQPLILFFYSF